MSRVGAERASFQGGYPEGLSRDDESHAGHSELGVPEGHLVEMHLGSF